MAAIHATVMQRSSGSPGPVTQRIWLSTGTGKHMECFALDPQSAAAQSIGVLIGGSLLIARKGP